MGCTWGVGTVGIYSLGLYRAGWGVWVWPCRSGSYRWAPWWAFLHVLTCYFEVKHSGSATAPLCAGAAGAEAVMCTYTCVEDPELFIRPRGAGRGGALSLPCCVWVSGFVLRAWRGVRLSDVLEKGMSEPSYSHVP